MESTARWAVRALVLSVGLVGVEALAQEIPAPKPAPPSIEQYATVESTVGGVPVYSFSNIVYVYGVSPDLLPGVVMQKGNANPRAKIKPKKSWEIKHNLCGSEHEMMPRSAANDRQDHLPIHLIDGDPNTGWSSWGCFAPDAWPEWIRIDLPLESTVASIALHGNAFPREMEVKLSRDARQWETVYADEDFSVDASGVAVVEFAPRRAKQVWIVGNVFPGAFSVREVEVRDPAGDNLALVSRGSGVTVSSTSYAPMNDRFTQDALWGPLQYDLGNKWSRVVPLDGTFSWSTVEQEKGKLEVDRRVDESITEAARNGMNVIMVLGLESNPLYSDSEMLEASQRYLGYMVRHFKDRVAYFEIGNECLWNAEQYMKGSFEPACPVIKRADPDARILLGGIAGFIPSLILDCLGQPWELGIRDGGLSATGSNLLVVAEDVAAKDVVVSVDALNDGEFAILLRYQNPANYLAAFYDQAQCGTICFRECVDGNLGPKDWLNRTWVEGFGPEIHIEARVEGSQATLAISDGTLTRTCDYTVQSIQDQGSVGLYQLTANQRFDRFHVSDLEGRTILKEEFNGPDGTLPPGWKKVYGGENPIEKGLGARIEGVAWHPCQPPDEAYFNAVRQLKKRCEALGFKGRFFANEIYAASIYPPGPAPQTQWACAPLLTEIGMAKYLAQSLVGHNGLDIEAGPCHPHFTGYPHPQSLCRLTWPVETINPCQPSVTYYVWRTIATAMDDFYPFEFPVSFSGDEKQLSFTFRSGDEKELMLAAWIPAGDWTDTIVKAESDITLPGVQAKQAWAIDIFNGTQQELSVTLDGSHTVLKGMLIKDYPTLVRVKK